MIKKIIFDVDNTLLNTDKDCFDAYKEYFKLRNLDDYYIKLYDIIGKYEDNNGSFDKDDLSKFINDNLDIEFTRKDFDDIFKIYEKHATILSDDTVSVLEELSKHYELVTLSKWYQHNQEARLKKADIYKYFKEVYGFENAGIKPDKNAFLNAAENTLPSECLVIGDSISNDIKVPLSLGMKAIYFNPNKRKTRYININRLADIITCIDKL